MNYIGSKHKLSSWIIEVVNKTVQQPLSELTFCDLFAGTGIVGRSFKPLVHKVIANDVEFYSFVLLKNYIENYQAISSSEKYIEYLNNLEGKSGFIAHEYGEKGRGERLFFSQANAEKIDACRQQIEAWKNSSEISEQLYYFLLASLLESADKVANTASMYGAFLKKLKASAAKEIEIHPATFIETETKHQAFQADANELIPQLQGDILYLDPPYNARQYGGNYHLLTTIAKYDTFVPKGKTGQRDYYRSVYCKKKKVIIPFEELIKQAKFSYIFLSYNNEGLMAPEKIKSIMSKYGSYSLAQKSYKRFKADKTENRNHKANQTLEYLHILKK
ncbi:DNA adenine methylase [Mesonia aestuariivivens]|uniref:DNA adenine methylase n=1 Tax=Mesonia aestuariivivens TaxID=2796128 RepID=A0ABS6W1V1_9FLAO|nr:DNA adenine methylase [Mesonia aestuariivivens]MBW2961511.1 DNA adenine methylase [Mesonia aestuariivivens]